MTFKPWTFFAVALAGWMNRQQQEVIEFLRMENRILREKLGHKRLILNESQKRRLATAAMRLGKDLLRQFGTARCEIVRQCAAEKCRVQNQSRAAGK